MPTSTEIQKNIDNVLKRPRVTEKASLLAEKGIYVFEIDPRANKTMVKIAVKEIYKVSPLKINITNLPAKSMTSRGIKGIKTGKKKAVVYLKKGDTIGSL